MPIYLYLNDKICTPLRENIDYQKYPLNDGFKLFVLFEKGLLYLECYFLPFRLLRNANVPASEERATIINV